MLPIGEAAVSGMRRRRATSHRNRYVVSMWCSSFTRAIRAAKMLANLLAACAAAGSLDATATSAGGAEDGTSAPRKCRSTGPMPLLALTMRERPPAATNQFALVLNERTTPRHVP